MMELHVWGKSSISIIDPESRAAAWLLCIHLKPQNIDFRIVPSSNTNLSDTNRLPLLKVSGDGKTDKYEGYSSISMYISRAYPSDSKFIPSGKLTPVGQLANLTFTTYLLRTLHYLNQYNLYVNTDNYEGYTRKLFSKYLPFPMNYNQPSRLHEEACEQVEFVGLGVNKTSMFSFRSEKQVAETETLNEGNEDKIGDSASISSLQENSMITKEKNKAPLKEMKNSLKCLGLLNGYMSHVSGIYKELNPDSPMVYAHLFRPKKVSSSELLLYSYFYSLTSVALPDRFIAKYLETEFPDFWSFASKITEALNSALDKKKFRPAVGAEIPSLWNEVKFVLGVQKY